MTQRLSDDEFLELLSDSKFYDDEARKIIEAHMEQKLKESESGDVDAMKFYARYYGNCYMPDLGKVEMFWYKKAAQAGDVYSMSIVGKFCGERCNPEENDVAESIKYLNMAIEHGDLRSLYVMAWKYYHGVDTRTMKYYNDPKYKVDEVVIPADKQKALEYFLRAAEGGYDEAMLNLAVFYAEGDIIEKDLDKSLYWFQKAVDEGNSEAAETLGNMFYKGEHCQLPATKVASLGSETPICLDTANLLKNCFQFQVEVG